MADDSIKQIENEMKELLLRVKKIEQVIDLFDFPAFKASWQYFNHEVGTHKGHLMYQQIDDIQVKVTMISTHLDAIIKNIGDSAAAMNTTSNEFFQLKNSVQLMLNKINMLESILIPKNSQQADKDGYRQTSTPV